MAEFGVVGVAAVLGAPDEPRDAIVLTAVLTGILLLVGAIVAAVTQRWAGDAFEIDPAVRAFRTPRGSVQIVLFVFLLGTSALMTEIMGWEWAHIDPARGRWLAALTVGLPAVLLLIPAGRENRVTLTSDGVTAQKPTGSVVIPWTALSPHQPRPDATRQETWLDLYVSQPGELRRTGLVRRRGRVAFFGVRPAFVAAAIRYYAAHPQDRLSIGTTSGYQRLIEVLDVPQPPPAPVLSRRGIAGRLVSGVVIFAGAVAVDDVSPDDLSFAGVALGIVRQGGAVIAVGLIATAVRGIWTRRRVTHEVK